MWRGRPRAAIGALARDALLLRSALRAYLHASIVQAPKRSDPVSTAALPCMKVTRVDTFKYWVDWCNWLFVRVTTDEGLVGWGEGSLHGAL